MSNTAEQPPCNVGDIIDYHFYQDDRIFLVFDCKVLPECRQYHCYSLMTGDIYKFQFPYEKPRILS